MHIILEVLSLKAALPLTKRAANSRQTAATDIFCISTLLFAVYLFGKFKNV